MAKIDKDSLKMVLVLTIISLIAALILSIVYSFVYKSDEELFKGKVSTLYTASEVNTVLDTSKYDNPNYTVVKNACIFEDGNIAVVILSKKAYSSSGIQLFVVFALDGEILSVTPYQHSETPGVGSNAMDKSHLNKFVGKNATDFALEVDTDGEVEITDWALFSIVDSITGATKTSTGVEYAIVGACQYFMTVNEVYNA